MTIRSNSFIRLPEVKERVGLSRSTIYLRISKGIFPKPICLGDRAVAWLQADIDEWIESRIKSSLNAKGDKHGK
jgi:prophage regulatory protein